MNAEPWKRREVIGDAVLYLGDCLEVMPGLAADSIDMIWTDPPYGHDNHNNDLTSRMNDLEGRTNIPIANDDKDGMRAVVDGMLSVAAHILKPNCCCCCCCCGGGPKPTFAWVADRMDRDGLSFFHSVIWDKKNPGLGWRYRRQHEMVMVSHRKNGRLAWSDTALPASNIISLPKAREANHPNEKPIQLVAHFLTLHTERDALVLDPFMGSGTTGVACAKMGRKFIGIELDEGYFDIACRRIDEAYRQPDIFIEPPAAKAQQEAMQL